MTTENHAGVHLDESDGIATLSIEGRTQLNLLGHGVFQALNQRVSQCCDDQDLRAIVLRGAGDRAFSAGVDLHEMKDFNPLQAEAFIRTLHAAARCLLHAPLPVVAAIRGPCLGGALEVALACDTRIATDDAIFGLPEVKVGLPSVIEASLLPRTVGLGRARKMLLTGETVDAPEALRIGLIDRIVRGDQLGQCALDAAREFLGMSRYILATQKVVGAGRGRSGAVQHQSLCLVLCDPASQRSNVRLSGKTGPKVVSPMPGSNPELTCISATGLHCQPGLSHMKLQPRHSGESRSPELVICWIFAAELPTSITGFPPSRE